MDMMYQSSPYERDEEHAAFAPMGISLYEYKNRPRRDNWATIAYCALMAFAVVGAIATFAATDGDAMNGRYSMEFYRNSTSCDLQKFLSTATSVPTTSTGSYAFTVSVSIWLPISVVLSIVFSVGYLYLFRRHAVKMVYVSVVASVAISVAMAVLAFAGGAVPAGIILLIMALISAGVFWWIRADLKLCGQLLSIAGRGLLECPGIIPTAVLIKFAGVGVMIYLAAGFVCGTYVGQLVKNPAAANALLIQGDYGVCQNSFNQTVDCCTFQNNGWGGFYCFIAFIALSWTAQVLLQLKLYVVADTIAQWYFQPQGSMDPDMQPSARRALRHGLTSSFGSICFAGAILAIINALRNALNNAQRQQQGVAALICCILNCIAQCFLSLLEQFTKFATIATAISGKGFIPAAKDLLEILKRNFLSTYNLWWIPDFVLGMAVFLVTLTWSCLVFFSTYLQWRGDFDGSTLLGVSFGVAFVALLVMGFILHFIASIMLNGVDTIYICFAFDRETKTVSHPEIHEIYQCVPSIKQAIIEQPDGGIAIGAQTQAPTQQPGPYQGYAPAHQPTGYVSYAPAGQPGYSGYGQPTYAGYAQPPAPVPYPPPNQVPPPAYGAYAYPPPNQMPPPAYDSK